MNSSTNIPLVDLSIQHERVWDEVRTHWDSVFERTSFVLGPAVAEFEKEYASFSNAKHCVGVANGGDALELSLRALDVGLGDEVILPANTFTATAMSILRVGAVPVVVDVDPVFHLINPESVAEAITEKTRAIVPVHLFGQMAPMEALVALAAKHNLVIVEDAAQSQGARQGEASPGSFGHIAATSFYPGKNLGAYGDAGAITTNDDALALRLMRIRNYGGIAKYEHSEFGCNSRLDSLQAAVLSVKLKYLREWNEERAIAAQLYEQRLAECPSVTLPKSADRNLHVWHLFVVQIDNRDEVLRKLNETGIGAGIHYPQPIHLQPALSDKVLRSGSLDVSERLASRILSLPMFPGITSEQVERVCESLKKFVTR